MNGKKTTAGLFSMLMILLGISSVLAYTTKSDVYAYSDDTAVIQNVTEEPKVLLDDGEITWTYSLSGSKATLTGYDTAPTGDLVIPDELDGYTVVGIGASLFLSLIHI